MLAAYSGAGHPSHTISLFSAMRTSSSPPDAFSLTSVIAAAADLHDLRTGEMLHSLSLRSGLCTSVPVSNCLVDMYGKCSFPSNAKKVFEEIKERNEVSWCSFLHGLVISGLLDEACDVFCKMPMRNLIAWNIMIMGFACSNSPEKSGSLFKDMLKLGFKGDVLTFVSLVNSYAELSDPCFGQMIHALIIQDGWIDAVEVSNSVLSFYARFGHYFDD
ncbi:hypothetical protein HPP92_002925 [Vanilla planifolia]|uniref:Pentatricopeptide repeat-containing protein n=1 Tax=Vanilla planifolia TaxID=51239 RepID=A0A835VMY5_VANPL|nr:hypothetical protein HPP92_002925 [Vanilla planifolia]